MRKGRQSNTLLFFSITVIVFLLLIGLLAFHRYKNEARQLSPGYTGNQLKQDSNANTTMSPDDKAIDDLLNSVDKDLQDSRSSLNEKQPSLQ